MTLVYLNLNCKGVAAILPAFLLPFIKTRHESGERVGGGGVGGMRAGGMGRGSRSKGGKQEKKKMEEMEQRQEGLEDK